MQNRMTFGVKRTGLRGLAMIATCALFAGVAMAQNTELRIMTPQAQRCVADCQARAASCYQHARTGDAKENCEVNGTRCKRGC